MGTDLFGTKSVFLGNKTFCGRNLLNLKTDWLQKLSCRAKNENLFFYTNQEMLRFKYLHQNRLCVRSCTAKYCVSFANNPRSQISQVSVGSGILILWPEEGKHGQTHFIVYTDLSLDFSELDKPAPKIFVSYNRPHFIFTNFQTRNNTEKVLIITTTTK